MRRVHTALAGLALALGASAAAWSHLGAKATAICCGVGVVACVLGIGPEEPSG